MSLPIPDTEQNDWDGRYEDEAETGADPGHAVWIIIPFVAALMPSTIYLIFYSLWLHGQASGNWFGRIGSLLTILVPILPMAVLIFTSITLFRSARNFFNDLYQPATSVNQAELIFRRLFGFGPYVVIRKEILDPDHDWVQWLGGPAGLVIYDGFALYVERGNRFSRILGPGIVYLDSNETVKAIIDLRPIVRPGLVKAWTKDGIKIRMDVRMECQIGLNGKPQDSPTKLVYPYDPIAVKKAVERTAVRYDQEKKCLVESKWVDGLWGKVQGFLATYISSHTVDELFLAEWGPSQIMSREASLKVLQELNKGLTDYGAQILNLQITNITIPEEVKRQRLQTWEAGRQSIAAVTEGQAKAYGIRALEKARAEAERDIIAAIAEGLEKIDPARLEESLLLSLSGILDQSLSDPVTRALITNETLDTLEKLKKLL